MASGDHPLAPLGKAAVNAVLKCPAIRYQSAVNNMSLDMFRRYRSDLDLRYIGDFNGLRRLPPIGPCLFRAPSLALRATVRES